MKKKRALPGINIQYPISKLILEGKKTIETRTYPIPKKYIKKEMYIIETPGKEGKFKARIIGTIVFGESFEYKNEKDFYRDTSKHCVTADSIWKWVNNKKKWGWPITYTKAFVVPKKVKGARGIVFTKSIS